MATCIGNGDASTSLQFAEKLIRCGQQNDQIHPVGLYLVNKSIAIMHGLYI